MYYVDLRTLDSGKNLFGLVTGPGAYQVWAVRDGTGTPVTRGEGGRLGLDKKALGLRGGKKRAPGPSPEPGVFTREEAVHVAHQVGRYYLGLGDLVWTYTTVDGLRADPSFFER